jgi:hypothetical protein
LTLPSPSNSTPSSASPDTSVAASPELDTTDLPSVPVAAPAAPAPVPPSGPVRFPIDWILRHASPGIQYRSLTEVVRVPQKEAEQVGSLPFTYRPALMLSLSQSPDGTWGGGMLSLPSARAAHFEGIGTIPAVRRLIEYGWHKDTPPLLHARRVLFRLLAEDEDPSFLFELAGRDDDEDTVRRGRTLLREASAAALAQAGYEGDPRLRGAARRIVTRMADYLRSPLAQKPFIRQGNQHMLAAEAAPPSMYAIMMLAYMPLFRAEHHREMDALFAHLTQAYPRQEAVQLVGRAAQPVPHLVLGDLLPHRNAADADVPFAVFWLELMARLGFLKRHENWWKLFERFLEDRDREGVWHPHNKGTSLPTSANAFVWPTHPLETQDGGEERWSEMTFRLGLIARLSGRPIELG